VDTKEIEVGSYEEARVALRQRRKDLGLSIDDVEDIAGMASSHLAKAEIPRASRFASLDTMALWAGALGYDIVLRPKPLTPKALRVLTEKRLNRAVLMRHG
jgi:transcriptional regulator with XRE-family HTH domain